jgi:hypothetical protein
MYQELYRYFVQHKNLHLPGIGSFIIERKPAEADFINKCIHPPVYSIILQQDEVKPSLKFYAWLGAAFGISEKEAIIRFNDFVFDFKKQINDGAKIEWEGVGTISKGLGDSIRFNSDGYKSFLQAIPAEKIIREKAEHAVLVGERERTSVEMTEYFSNPDAKKNYWWVLPVTIALLAFMFIGWYLSDKGMNTSGVSNATKISTVVAGETHKEIR